jgi:hypothetical protein
MTVGRNRRSAEQKAEKKDDCFHNCFYWIMTGRCERLLTHN